MVIERVSGEVESGGYLEVMRERVVEVRGGECTLGSIHLEIERIIRG